MSRLHFSTETPRQAWRVAATLVIALAALPSLTYGKTILLTDADCEAMAAIGADAPRQSWAGTLNSTAEFGNHYLDIGPKTSFLIRYPIDKIPADQRITKAEWTVPYTAAYPVIGVRLNIRRCLVSWGAGVCHLYRTTRPEPVAWNKPGAAGLGKDRAAKATASAIVTGIGEQTFNVTQDVELWHSGAAPNQGWLVTAEDPDTMLRMNSPFWQSPKGWKLKITYEPK